jgi:hypothetical protein
MRGRSALVWVAVTVLAMAVSGSASTRPSTEIALRIKALDGSIAKVGSIGSSALYGVRLRATLCLPSPAAALSAYPSEIRITHFAVSRSRSRWWAARTSIDRAPWLVPLGEAWHGKACGQIRLEDAIPAQHYGVESLGNARGCYGVGLTIKTRGAHASRRIVLVCGRRFG